MNRRMLSIVLTIPFLSSVIPVASANIVPDVSVDNFSLELSTGVMGGKAKEVAYYSRTGHRMSQLNWETNHAPVLNAVLTWNVRPDVSIGLSGWTTFARSKNTMSDYDWMDGASAWYDKSSSSSTYANYVNEFDLHSTYWFLTDDHYRSGLRLGYKENRFSWTSYGGSYVYDNGAETGELPSGKTVIGYRQKLMTPYIALAGRYIIDDFDFNLIAKYSFMARMKDNDEHYLRDTRFRDNVKEATYYGLSFDAGYTINPNTRLFAGLDYNVWPAKKGVSHEYDYLSGESYSGGEGSAGISNRTWLLIAGVSFKM